MQAGGGPHDRQVDKSTPDVVLLHLQGCAVRAGAGHIHQVGVDNGEGAGVSSVGGSSDRVVPVRQVVSAMGLPVGF